VASELMTTIRLASPRRRRRCALLPGIERGPPLGGGGQGGGRRVCAGPRSRRPTPPGAGLGAADQAGRGVGRGLIDAVAGWAASRSGGGRSPSMTICCSRLSMSLSSPRHQRVGVGLGGDARSATRSSAADVTACQLSLGSARWRYAALSLPPPLSGVLRLVVVGKPGTRVGPQCAGNPRLVAVSAGYGRRGAVPSVGDLPSPADFFGDR